MQGTVQLVLLGDGQRSRMSMKPAILAAIVTDTPQQAPALKKCGCVRSISG